MILRICDAYKGGCRGEPHARIYGGGGHIEMFNWMDRRTRFGPDTEGGAVGQCDEADLLLTPTRVMGTLPGLGTRVLRTEHTIENGVGFIKISYERS